MEEKKHRHTIKFQTNGPSFQSVMQTLVRQHRREVDTRWAIRE